MNALFALLKASLVGFARDRASVAWTLAFPIALLALFSVLFNGGGAASYRVGWVDEARSPGAATLRTALEGSGFELVDGKLADGRSAMTAGQLKAIVEVPAGFGDDSVADARVRVHVDASDRSTTSAIVTLVDRAVARGSLPDGAPETNVDVVPVQAQALNPASYFVPTILAMALMQLGVYSAVTLVQQRERQILKRFATAPIERWSVIGSFVSARLVVAVIQTVLMLVAGRLLAGTAATGNPLAIGALVLLTAATFIAIGFALAGLAKSEESATQITGFVTLPLMFLSGLFIPVEQLPDLVRPIAAVLPLSYAADALRQVMVAGTPVVPLTTAVAVLVAWLVGSLVVATRLFRWN